MTKDYTSEARSIVTLIEFLEQSFGKYVTRNNILKLLRGQKKSIVPVLQRELKESEIPEFGSCPSF